MPNKLSTDLCDEIENGIAKHIHSWTSGHYERAPPPVIVLKNESNSLSQSFFFDSLSFQFSNYSNYFNSFTETLSILRSKKVGQ